jgi:hypothetical protein
MESKLKHLEFIQSVINRMASNSFFIKGWSLTLVSAVLVLAAKDGDPAVVPVAYVPVLVFWFLDAYFLRQEKIFRKMYDEVRTKAEQDIDFDLNPYRFADAVDGYFKVFFSITLRFFHGALLIVVIGVHLISARG